MIKLNHLVGTSSLSCALQQLCFSDVNSLFLSDETLYMQGLAVGFVLLRVEALTEEGKL